MAVNLDQAASAPLAPEAFEAMCPWLGPDGANAASTHHGPGRAAAAAVAEARKIVARLLGHKPSDVVFTASATEACNLAIKGILRPLLRRGEAVHCVAPLHEHPAVLDPLRRLEREGAEVTLIRPPTSGIVDAALLEPHLRGDTRLVACMHANNETGTINDIASVQALCRARGIQLMVDAAQSAGRIDVATLDADMLVASSHKMHGPPGAAAVAFSGGGRSKGVEPLIEGGGHEQGLRSGSLNVPAIVGFAAACTLWAGDVHVQASRLAALRDRLEAGLLDALPASSVNGDPDRRLPTITNLTLATGRPEPIPSLVPDVACSTGAACSSANGGPSHVLEAMGVSAGDAAGTVRLSLGRYTSDADIDFAIEAFARISR